MATATASTTSQIRTLAHALGNVLIGIALGLGVYYLATDAVQYLRQSQLGEELEMLGSIGADYPDRYVDTGPEMDFTDWASEDEAYWLGLEDGDIFGRLIIDPIELDTVVINGHSRANLKRGPAYVSYTDLPGPTGNTGISGHRTTYGAPFRNLDALEPGDTIDLYSPYRRYRYSVSDVFRVRPWETEVLTSTVEPQLTLTACDPPYSAAWRLIVSADLVDVGRLQDE
jgi:LPXTG-site transpeptidase (sortase) family protein